MGRKKKVEEAETKRNTPRVSLDNTAAKFEQEIEKPADLVMLDKLTVDPMEMPKGAVANKQPGISTPASRDTRPSVSAVESNYMPTKAEANNPVNTIKTPAAPTISDMLAQRRSELRKAAEKDKTDAVKMQKYYALTDALGALGKMGGTAIGGAIGGNMMDSAPIVADYQPSRGYLNAFEQAKQANERLRALDEQDFQLAYAKQQRDEERAYQQKMIKDEREYKAEMDKLDKQWQKDMIDYKSKIEQATLENNLALRAKYEAEAADREQKYWKMRAAINHKYNMDEKQWGHDIVKTQMGGRNQPFTLTDGTVANIPSNVFEEMKSFFVDKGLIDGTYINPENVESFLRTRPDLVADFVSKHGVDYKTDYVAPEYKSPEEVKAEQVVNKESEKKARREHRKQNQNFSSPTIGNTHIKNTSHSSSNQSDEEALKIEGVSVLN